MNINLKLSGVAEKIIDEMIARGYAASKTEAIRIAILDYKQHHMEKGEDEMTKEDLKDLEKAIKEYSAGKTVSLEDV
jgi:Arc/MetJ-type ribon-helix-helix transcriptional regulator